MAKMKTTHASADYEVGRGKPPRSSQFKPGQSGNPGGRRKGSRNFKTNVLDVLDSEIELTEGGRTRRVPMIEALMLRQVQEGLRGHLRAIDSLLDRYERHAGQEVEQADELPEDDLALLKQALGSSQRRQRCRSKPAPDSLFAADEEDVVHE
ncbi:DUF5681 domain-containing protein [Microvirga roseola]|uniref:DUF5681 domain-containing protein n=1 Tax=Microvirga roseola TaxID=2883126 RepID=UPI001E2C4C60|nr:DUF5681 domain-containing protein [Microvirga roseola]